MHNRQPTQRVFPGKVWASLLLAALALLASSALWASAAPGESASPQSAADGQALFEQKCKGCHTISGGRLVGPDLVDVDRRRDPAWVKAFITAPDKMISSEDPTAVQLLGEYKIQMPNLGLTPVQVDSLVAYLANPTAAGAAAPAPAQAALPAGDANRGRLAFTGGQSLVGGGPACLSCHTVAGLSALGGGSLGPDLTHAVQRYGGPTGMASTLATLPFPTMQGIFATRALSPGEQADLLAFLVQQDKQYPAAGQIPTLKLTPLAGIFLAVAALGTLALFGALLFYWAPQRQSLSAKLRKNA